MKNLEDIKHDKDLQSQIRWDMKPRERIQRTANETTEEMDELQSQLKERVGYYFYIDFYNKQSMLCLYQNYPDGSGKFIADITEIPQEMLQQAVQEAGGSTKVNGKHPINDKIKKWLKEQLEN